MIKTNMGTFDRAIRIFMFIVIIILFITNQIEGVLGYVLISAGIVFLITSLIGFCPLYKLFGFDTCNTKSIKKDE